MKTISQVISDFPAFLSSTLIFRYLSFLAREVGLFRILTK